MQTNSAPLSEAAKVAVATSPSSIGPVEVERLDGEVVHHAVVGGDLDRDLFELRVGHFYPDDVVSIGRSLRNITAGSAELHAASPSMSPATLSIMKRLGLVRCLLWAWVENLMASMRLPYLVKVCALRTFVILPARVNRNIGDDPGTAPRDPRTALPH